MGNYSQEQKNSLWWRLHLDWPLLLGLVLLMGLGMFVLYSASGESMAMLNRQLVRIALATVVMFVLAQVPPDVYLRWAPFFFFSGLLMLLAVLIVGDVGKGAQRWLDLGFIRFQPSEIMKLAVPLMVARYISQHPLPPSFKHLLIGATIAIAPTLLIAKQPDLGTSLLVAASGIFALFLAGMSWRLVGAAGAAIAAFIPLLWFFLMRDYQRQRVLTLLNPESDPLGAGYHIIQSKIAIGSGGFAGKGWLQGTQSQLDFLPERHTDFIFAVFAEEFGFLGVVLLMCLYFYIIGRGLFIATQAQTAFGRLLAGCIILTFFVYIFVNIGMVSGLLPVVGVPLPLVSYGGTSIVTLMAGFGILMSVHTHKRLYAQ
ncbi:rod shape-determining protein RodA [Agarivorans sp. OAG1]|uniref:Peptidoglycan glycosyltransferase MrdB n=1 Tax=Agarivorans albus MKT 106 TaxID=1331007 RepID=R9PM46_AGAAL|nr:rod shape-determining protein RodA [Agarivorans albus]BEU02568.1 rod shape-determining protein RodA [Agarivorans sp. OAG1]GAD02434.1 rod shape-determining protein RodA [Agarivorans albus MKT 106]